MQGNRKPNTLERAFSMPKIKQEPSLPIRCVVVNKQGYTYSRVDTPPEYDDKKHDMLVEDVNKAFVFSSKRAANHAIWHTIEFLKKQGLPFDPADYKIVEA